MWQGDPRARYQISGGDGQRLAIWNAYKNQYWPAHYLIDAQGVVRDQHFGEGEYAETEQTIMGLLQEANGGKAVGDGALVAVQGEGATAASSGDYGRSPETYLGYAKLSHLVSPESVKKDAVQHYSTPKTLKRNEWALAGDWSVGEQTAVMQGKGGAISFRFYGRDLHLVLGTKSGQPVRYKVTLDGKAPAAAHGADIDAQGLGMVTEQRLYQLIRLPGELGEHVFRIEFLDSGAEAYAFTFG